MKKIVILFICGICLSACSQPKQEVSSTESTPTILPQEDATDEEPKDNSIDAVTGATNVANAASFNGLIALPADCNVTVTLTMGGSVHHLSLLPGQYVRKGEIIATLENPEFISLQQAYLEASAQAEYLQKEYERQQVLAAQDAASQKRLQQSKADYLAEKSRLNAAAAQLTLLGVNLQALQTNSLEPYLAVKAPLSGYVTNLNANAGKYFNAGEPICDIINKERLLLQLTAYEKDLGQLHVGDSIQFRVNGFSDEVFEARLISIDQSVDEQNRSIKIYAQIRTPNQKFRPGMYVSARIRKNL